MWSGPRNISTALMRSWGNRDDTVVVDEPLYAHYLAVTGLAHPGREQVIAHHETDWRRVVEMLLGAAARGHAHLLPEADVASPAAGHRAASGSSRMTHAFLIRDPRAMLASLAEKLEEFDARRHRACRSRSRSSITWCATTGRVPPVRGLGRPARGTRGRCCGGSARRSTCRSASGCSAWPPGRRDTDGIWAPWWYDARRGVDRLRDASPRRPPRNDCPAELAAIEAQCRPLYDKLCARTACAPEEQPCCSNSTSATAT